MQHAEGSLRQYQTAWQLFLAFLVRKGIQHSSVSVATLLDFLADEALNKRRAYRTVAAYKCALKLPFSMHYNVDVDDPLTTSFMRGLFRKKPPCRGAPLPTWDLTDLLKYLKSPEFEPLERAPWPRLI